MNNYIITHENLNSHGKEQEFIVSALYNEKKKMVEVTLDPAEEESLLGNIYIGRVENVVQNLNAAFIKIGPDQICYYSLEDYRNPLFTKKLSPKKKLVAGEEIVVQVVREALKSKEPAVTTNLSFAGKYAVLTTENTRIGISSKLQKENRERLKKLISQVEHPDFGLILRTNAQDASDEEILSEIKTLAEEWKELKETAKYKTCYSCLKKEMNPCLKELKNLPVGTVKEIITDDRNIYEELCAYYGIEKDALMTKGSVSVPVDELNAGELTLKYYRDPMLTLSSLYGIKASLEGALKERVWLKSGAYLIIQPTEALTVIDVNSGKNIVRKDMQENFLKINLEAAKEIAYQLRLRNISGIIIIDFISLKSKEAEELLLKEFRAALKQDPVKTDIIDMTKLGLVEVTRKKVKRPLYEVLKEF